MTAASARRFVLPALVGLAAGCGAKDDVRTYEVPREAVTAPAAKPVAVAPPEAGSPVRTLGAIIPAAADDSESSYFVKCTGPAGRVAPHVAVFQAFVETVKPTGDPKAPVAFDPPAGARSVPPTQFRLATFQVGPPDAVVEFVVSGPFRGGLLANVNRWRKEVGLPEVTAAELPPAAGPLKTTLVDLTGTAQAGGMMRGPFQKN